MQFQAFVTGGQGDQAGLHVRHESFQIRDDLGDLHHPFHLDLFLVLFHMLLLWQSV